MKDILEDFHNEIDNLLTSYPHQIPPGILSIIVDVKERLYGLKNMTKLLASASGKQFYELKNANTILSKQLLELFTTFFSRNLKNLFNIGFLRHQFHKLFKHAITPKTYENSNINPHSFPFLRNRPPS